MAKRKEQKKKDRERRVAQKKLAAQKHAQEQKNKEPATGVPKSKKVFNVESGPKKDYIPTTAKKSTHTHRRSGGG